MSQINDSGFWGFLFSQHVSPHVQRRIQGSRSRWTMAARDRLTYPVVRSKCVQAGTASTHHSSASTTAQRRFFVAVDRAGSPDPYARHPVLRSASRCLRGSHLRASHASHSTTMLCRGGRRRLILASMARGRAVRRCTRFGIGMDDDDHA